MIEQQSTSKVIRLLFLGSFETDRRIKSFARLFSRNGFDPQIIYAEPGINALRKWSEGSVQITQLPLRFSSGPLMFLEYRFILSKYLSSISHADVIFAADLYSLSTARILKKNGRTKKLIYDARELYTELPTISAKPFVKHFWKQTEERGLMISDRVIVTAPLDVDAIKSVHGFLPQSLLIRNLPEQQTLSTKTNYLRDKYTIRTRKILVYAGGIQKDRGLEVMIDAMHQLQNDYALVLIGDGSLVEELVKRVKTAKLDSSVFFHPAVNSDLLLPILASSDIGVCMIQTNSGSYELALPSKIFEYFQAGLPVLSSKMKQVKSLFPNEQVITYIDPTVNDVVIGLNELSSVLSNTLLLEEISQRINISFTFDTDAHSLLSLFNT